MCRDRLSYRQWIPTLGIGLILALLVAAPAAAQPGTLKFDEDSFEVLEEAGVAMIRVERSQGEDGAVSVQYSTADGTATAGSDYTATSGTFNWASGDGSDRVFMVPILDDAVEEGVESIQLILSNPTGGAVLDPERGTSVLNILASDGGAGGDDDNGGDDNGGDDNGGDDNGGDDDNGDGEVGLFKFDQRDFQVVEGAGVAVISVERSQGETGAASVDYSASAGTATAGADFTPVSGTLSWASGEESSKVFMVPITKDGMEEGPETVKLMLDNPTGGASLSELRATAVLTILDDDAGQGTAEDDSKPGVLKFDETSFEAFESSATATIRVERSKGEGGLVSVRYTASDGSATDGLDYTTVTGILSWGNGDGSVKTFDVPLLGDDLTEGNESVILTLSEATGGATIDPDRGASRLVILDDDGNTSACVAGDSTLCLLGGRFRVEAQWRTDQGTHGSGRVIPSSDRAGLIWFFNQNNPEILVKMLDACDAFGAYWVFYAATTNVDFTLEVTDTQSGQTKQYSNPLGLAAEPVQDTGTFTTCP
jgi:hypothetical protein